MRYATSWVLITLKGKKQTLNECQIMKMSKTSSLK